MRTPQSYGRAGLSRAIIGKVIPCLDQEKRWQTPILSVDIWKQHIYASNSSLENAGEALLISSNDIVYTSKLWSNRQTSITQGKSPIWRYLYAQI